ncbi:putative propionyl-CoA carboxylase beta chain 5 domain protein [Mycobacterium kansasii]|uniref:Putative propionyl-CoA carboxylase beta chain 5 domain protein n=1 Tax=Mycobacterium kansasii TaxID=1768 RepID=A0A1V3WBW5_MYCKA|nr:putative propionyl-CoA carboxylase beta chain 5 domain protein [Mycobacterium kansasii]
MAADTIDSHDERYRPYCRARRRAHDRHPHHRGKLAELHKRRAESLHPVGETAIEKVHAKAS